jgi:hypothetical protein
MALEICFWASKGLQTQRVRQRVPRQSGWTRIASFVDVPGGIALCLNKLLPLPHQTLPLPHEALPLPHPPASAGFLQSHQTPSRGLCPAASP